MSQDTNQVQSISKNVADQLIALKNQFAASPDIINLKIVVERQAAIKELEKTRKLIDDLIAELKVSHERDQELARRLFMADDGEMGGASSSTAADRDANAAHGVEIEKQTAGQKKWSDMVRSSISATSPESASKLQKNNSGEAVPIATISRDLCIHAVVVQDFKDVEKPGVTYYVSSADHYAIKIDDILIHGNIGNISDRNTDKLRACRYGSACSDIEKCSYYHDPLIVPGSRDRRNYTPYSWQYGTNPLNRRFGSYDKLDSDIKQLTREEIDRFSCQLAHDFLCLRLLLSAKPHLFAKT